MLKIDTIQGYINRFKNRLSLTRSGAFVSSLVFFLLISPLYAQTGRNVQGKQSYPGKEWQKGGRFDGYSPEQEIIAKRSQNSKLFLNPNGTITAQVADQLHYKDEDGAWQDMDFSIRKQSTGYSNTTNSIKSYFPLVSGERAVEMKIGERSGFKWWQNPKMEILLNQSVVKTYPAKAAPGTAQEEKLTYANVYPGISEEFAVIEDGLENNTIISHLAPAISALSGDHKMQFSQFIPLKAGWKVFANGKLQTAAFSTETFVIEMEEEHIYFGKIIIFDNGITRDDAMLLQVPEDKITAAQQRKIDQHVTVSRYKISFVDGGIRISSDISLSWLKAAGRSFPVTVDPTVTITPASSAGNFYGPLTHWYGFQRHADLYLQSEIGGYGNISSIEYNSTSTTASTNKPTRVYMRTTTATALSSSAAWNSAIYTGTGSQLCFNANTDQGTTTGWKMITLSSVFNYASDNLLVMVYDAYGSTGSAKYYNGSSSTSTVRRAYYRQDNTDPGDAVSTITENRLAEIRITYSPAIPVNVGWTGYSGTSYPAAGTCGNWSAAWCAGSGTYSYLSLVQNVSYTVENTGAATCGTALPSAWLQAWWAGGATSCGWGSIGSPATNSITFNAQITGDHIINVSSNSGSANSCGSATQHDFTGRSAVLRYIQNTTVSNTTINAAICQGGTKSLTATLGGAHNNPAVTWSIVSGGGTISGTTYTATTAGSVTVRATVGVCSSDVVFNVNSTANDPGAISVPVTVCAGTSATISNVLAATTGTPTSSAPTYYFYWRQTSPAVVGWTMYESTTNNYSTLPAVVTNNPGTYFVARNSEFGCSGQLNNATTIDIPITVIGLSTAPTGIANSGAAICPGNAVTLAPTGGTLAAGASYEWFTGSCGGTSAGTGATLTVSPTSTTTYFVRASAAGGCAATACASGTLTLPAMTTALSTTESATCQVSGSSWVHFYSSSGKLIASINPNGNNLGAVTATSYVNPGAILTQACGTTAASYTTAALGRRWVITPTNNFPATIKLPFADAEFSSLQTAAIGTTANPMDNVSTISNLKLSKYSGINQNSNWADNCADGGTLLISTQAASGAITTGNGFMGNITSSSYVQFNIPGFSEFWLHNSSSPSPLPVELTSLSASCNGNDEVSLSWKTLSEQNSQKFIVQKSRDLGLWVSVTDVPANGNSSHEINYSMTDTDPYSGVSYYRLVQVDNDGTEQIYGPISVSCANGANSMVVFPNPTRGDFTVEISSLEDMDDAVLQISDLTGKVISARSLNVLEGKNQVLFHGLELQAGTYIVRLISQGSGIQPVRVVVNH